LRFHVENGFCQICVDLINISAHKVTWCKAMWPPFNMPTRHISVPYLAYHRMHFISIFIYFHFIYRPTYRCPTMFALKTHCVWYTEVRNYAATKLTRKVALHSVASCLSTFGLYKYNQSFWWALAWWSVCSVSCLLFFYSQCQCPVICKRGSTCPCPMESAPLSAFLFFYILSLKRYPLTKMTSIVTNGESSTVDMDDVRACDCALVRNLL